MKQQIKLWDKLKDTLNSKMRNRTRVLNPFRLDAFKHIYQVALDAEEWAAFNFIRSREIFTGVFRTTTTAETMFAVDVDDEVRFSIRFSDQWRNDLYPDVETPWEAIHPKAREYIRRWVIRHRELEEDERYVKLRLRDVEYVVNTWGQAARVWPQLASFSPPEMKKKYNRRKATSSLPDGSWITTAEGEVKLHQHLTPEFYTHASELLAEASLLPEYSRERFGERPTVS